MKAIAITQPGGPEVLQLVERADPVAGVGECLIRVQAYGINRPDVLQRRPEPAIFQAWKSPARSSRAMPRRWPPPA